MPLSTSPDALRDLVLSLLQKQQEKEAEFTSRFAEQEQAIIPATRPSPAWNTLAKLRRWRFGRRSEQLSKDQISL